MSRFTLVPILLSMCILLCAGCGKKSAEEPVAPSQSLSRQDVSAPEPVPTEPAPPAAEDPGDSRVAALVAQLGDAAPEKQADAAYLLGKMGPKAAPAIEALAKRLTDSNYAVIPSTGNRESQAEIAGKALVAIGPEAIPVLVDTLSVRGASSVAVTSLGTLGAAAVDPVIELFDSQDPFVRAQARAALKAIGEPAVGPLLETLKGSPAYQRRDNAAQTLGEMEAKVAVPALVAALGDESRLVRNAVARALGQIKDPAALRPLCKMLADGPDKYDRVVAAKALGTLGDEDAVQPLITALEAKDDDIREAAVTGLGMLKAAEAVEPIAKLTRDEDGDTREAAYVALGQIGDKRAVMPLLAALKEEESERRRCDIVDSLGLLGDPAVVPTLLEEMKVTDDYTLLRSIADALKEMPDAKALPVLVETLKEGHEHGVNSRICEVLTEIGKPSVVPMIGLVQDGTYAAMESADQSVFVRALAKVTRVRQERDSKKILEWWEQNKAHYDTPQ